MRLGLLMLLKLKDVGGRWFVMLTDNVVTEGAVRNGKSRDRWVNRQWKLIQAKLLETHCFVKQVRVKSADNEADRLSRGRDPRRLKSDELWVDVPQDLQPFISQE